MLTERLSEGWIMQNWAFLFSFFFFFFLLEWKEEKWLRAWAISGRTRAVSILQAQVQKGWSGWREGAVTTPCARLFLVNCRLANRGQFGGMKTMLNIQILRFRSPFSKGMSVQTGSQAEWWVPKASARWINTEWAPQASFSAEQSFPFTVATRSRGQPR